MLNLKPAILALAVLYITLLIFCFKAASAPEFIGSNGKRIVLSSSLFKSPKISKTNWTMQSLNPKILKDL